MNRKSNGIMKYTKIHLCNEFTVMFPKDDYICKWCIFCTRDPSNSTRHVCIISNEILPFHTETIPDSCRLNWSEL